ncbi:L2 capsid protein [Bos taurus papillomavirus 18]|uniref:Minor capsid protein L2 n=1 Tax=Bos taurus papillomavirus 18 TaxID=1887216 RepID=A0A1B2K2B2_9PAPI|nr:L2 capsid protein [Bos taurus papillomavirus 18]ANZ90248.1 L2 capsid protein [Bos taurus papillomavirus 18]
MATNKRSRVKRASVSDLAKTCATGDCPEDVYNKVTGNTLADKILRFLSPFLYFGGLSIGTGAGGGGRFGYRPIGGTSGGGRPTVTVRPVVPVETIAPEIEVGGTIDSSGVIDAAGPSVIELTPINGDPTVIDVAPDTAINETGPPILEVTPEVRVTVSGRETETVVQNPTFTPDPSTINTSHNENIVFEPNTNAVYVGSTAETSEEIELSVFSRGDTFSDSFATEVEETSFDASTPLVRQAEGRPINRFGRYFQQVPVSEPEFLSRPASMVTFGNAAYDPDATAIFEDDLRDLEDIAAAPYTDFSDLKTLSRPYYSRGGRTGRLIVSRVGTKSTIHTRSGLSIGASVHYYTELSTINEPTVAEQPPFEISDFVGSTSADEAFINSQGTEEFELISLRDPSVETLDETSEYSETALLDHIEEIGENLRLIIQSDEREQTIISVPSFNESVAENAVSIVVDYPNSTSESPATNYPMEYPTDTISPSQPATPGLTPLIPSSLQPTNYFDYWQLFEPSLWRSRKRKRNVYY